ncbi:MAG TPA: competence/damage-inducible protein A [Bacillota bacterium]|nr:competence/damage-inducible protein A [Bacillota bacterium]
MEQKRTEFIAVGTELLLGQIANTNAQWFSHQLASYGFNMFHHTVVGDNLQRVKDVFMQAQKRSDIIIVSGGLGPTEDDLTREAFQEMSHLPLDYDEHTMSNIQAFYKKQGIIMPSNNNRQARVFSGAYICNNKHGMAPGMILTFKNVKWIFLPGVPTEMKQMAEDDVFPYLIQEMSEYEVIESRVIKCIGIGESTLEERLKDLIQHQTNPTIALLAQEDGMIIRLTVKSSSKEEADEKIIHMTRNICNRIGEYVYGFDEDTIAKRVIQLLANNEKTIAAAESLTGGAFTNQLIKVEGASVVCPGSMVTYDTRIKRDVLHVPSEVIEEEGVVSEACALEMAKQISARMNTTLGISFTGVAGPERLEGNEVGTTYISIYSNAGDSIVRKYVFSGNRTAIQKKSVMKGFEMLYHYLSDALDKSS